MHELQEFSAALAGIGFLILHIALALRRDERERERERERELNERRAESVDLMQKWFRR